MNKSSAAENSATHVSRNSQMAENYSMQKIANVADSSASRHSADFGCMLA